nr:hypothetical protein [Kutzneria sp. 744]
MADRAGRGLVDDQVAAEHLHAGVGAVVAQVPSTVRVGDDVLDDQLLLAAESERARQCGRLVGGRLQRRLVGDERVDGRRGGGGVPGDGAEQGRGHGRGAAQGHTFHRVSSFLVQGVRPSDPALAGSDGSDIGNGIDPAESRTRYVIGKSLAVIGVR